MNIGKQDVLWNYAATFLQIGAGVILLPFILRTFPSETVAIWSIFSSIIALTSLLDFGFNPSFTRNVSYIVSGVRELKATGYEVVEKNSGIDYGLFKGLINAMRWFYRRMAVLLFAALATAGTYYLYVVLREYSGSTREVYAAWIILCAINTYSLYTLYYDALMQGMGLIRQAKQIQIAGQILYLFTAATLILLRYNLIAIVSAQALSIIVKRVLAYRAVYTPELKRSLAAAKPRPSREFIRPILPNAVKLGLTSVGGFLVQRSALIIGSLYLPLDAIASYGITAQITGIIGSTGWVYFSTYQPKIAQYRVYDDKAGIRRLYLRSCLLLAATFALCGAGLLLFGDWTLEVIGSKTPLLARGYIALLLLIAFLENNHGIAGNVLLSKNEVPFFRAALVAGGVTMILTVVFLRYLHLGVLGMILAPGIAQGHYQNWKWPLEVSRELKIIKAEA